MATNFYKKDGSYYIYGSNKKVSNLDELRAISAAGGKEVSAPTATKQATLYGPNGSKETVDVGSSRAAELQKQGWGLTAGSYKAPAKATTTSSTAAQPTKIDSSKEPKGTAIKTNKTDVVNTFRRLIGKNPTTQEDWNNVYYLMTKAPADVEKRLTASSKTSTRTGQSPTAKTDPYRVAAKYGYTVDDFKNDPNFEKYWGSKSEQELEEALKKRGDFSVGTGRKRTESEQSGFIDYKEHLDAMLESGQITNTQYNALLNIYDNEEYTSGKKIYSEEEYRRIAGEEEAKARTDLEPYFALTEKQDMEDLRNKYSDIRNEALRYKQQEEKSYKEKLDATKKDLRARGMTFSGMSRKTIGAEGALANEGVEGELPQQRRYDWEDARSAWQETARDIGTEAERMYGSDKLHSQRDYLNPEGLPDPYAGGITYRSGKTAPIYLPHKDSTQDGYVSKTQAEKEREKEYEVQKRKEARMATYQYS